MRYSEVVPVARRSVLNAGVCALLALPVYACGDASRPDARVGADETKEASASASAGDRKAPATTLKPGQAPANLAVDPRFKQPHWVFGRKSLMSKKGPYNHVHVAQGKTIRTLSFYKDNRAEMLQTAIDLQEPHVLRLEYGNAMFASFVFRPAQPRVLIVGLGGGSMVHFLHHYYPETHVDVVEIDPVVVEATREWFAVDNDEHTKIHVGDGIKFVQDATERWDAIYMDAFLKPTAEGTNSAGIPQHATTVAFVNTLGERLNDGGVLVFHMHTRGKWNDDYAAIREAFPHTTRVVRRGSTVIFASRSPFADKAGLAKQAEAPDEQHGWAPPMADIIRDLRDD